MKRRKGFTLIELLAVIVILAVIALIATPLIMNTINDAKKGAAKSSALEYVRTVETNAAKELIQNTKTELTGKYNICGDYLCEVSGKQILKVEVKGTKPQAGSYVMLEKNNVVGGKLTIDGFDIGLKEDGEDYEVGEQGSIPSLYLDGEVVYFNPVDNELCTVEDYEKDGGTTSEKKTGCMKWYAFGDTEGATTVRLLLDHNTTNKLSINGCKSVGITTVNNRVVSDASGWHADVKSTARLLKATEVLQITNNESFDLDTIVNVENVNSERFYFETLDKVTPSIPEGQAKFAWLFDNLESSKRYGGNVNMSEAAYSYYTDFIKYNFNAIINWSVTTEGSLECVGALIKTMCNMANYDSSNLTITSAIRPVITITK